MASGQTFACPSCGGTLTVQGDAVQVKCPFCDNTVAVPEALRTPRSQSHGRSGRQLVLTLLAGISGLCLCWVFISFLNFVLQISQAFVSVGGPTTQTPEYSETFLYLSTGGLKSGQWIAVDGAGDIFVTTSADGWVYQFDATGHYLNRWLPPGTDPPSALAADAAGNVYVVRQGAILKYNGATAQLTGKYQGGDYFLDVALLPDGGMMAVSKASGDDLVNLDSKGQVLGRISNATSRPVGQSDYTRVAVGGSGNIYVLSAFTDKFVSEFTPQGQPVAGFGTSGQSPGQLYLPEDIAVDAKDKVYISDVKGIEVFDGQGQFVRRLSVPSYDTPSGLALDARNALVSMTYNSVLSFVPR